MLSQPENELLTCVGPGTAMGELLRSYWFPALCSYEVAKPGGAPVPFSLLGEELVAFRDSEGEVGILEAHCPHRCASLQLARNEDGGLTCIYHGWRIRRDGVILETPNEPERTRIAGNITHLSYPVKERGGVIWTYLGPKGEEPELPEFEWMSMERSHVSLGKVIVACNWLQVLEGLVDSSHVSFLHRDRVKPSADVTTTSARSTTPDQISSAPTADTQPTILVEDMPYGFRYGAIRRPLVEPDRLQHVRTTQFIMPFFCLIPPPAGWGGMDIAMPIDDTHTVFYEIKYRHDAPVDEDLIRQQMGRVWDVDVSRDHRRIAGPANGWLQDRAAMEEGRAWSGMKGSINEDAAVTEAMGPIVDRTREHLGSADRAVQHLRQLLLAAVADKQKGEPALGRNVSIDDVRAGGGLIPLDAAWQTTVDTRGTPAVV